MIDNTLERELAPDTWCLRSGELVVLFIIDSSVAGVAAMVITFFPFVLGILLLISRLGGWALFRDGEIDELECG